MTIQLPDDLVKKINEGMHDSTAIILPFPAPTFWTLNGQASYKQQNNALYFGGWACKVEDMQTCLDNGLTLPAGLSAVTIATRDGSEYDAYIGRLLLVAPICKRMSYLLEGKRHPAYVEGGRKHVQILAYLAEKREKSITPWGPVVLSAKGYQAKNLLDNFTAWDKLTSKARHEIAPNIPAWCFYAGLGTFGKERNVEQVGKQGTQSPITPIKLYQPENMTNEQVASLFVGQDVAAIMADLLEQSTDWRNAWKQDSQGDNGNGGDYPAMPEFNEDTPF